VVRRARGLLDAGKPNSAQQNPNTPVFECGVDEVCRFTIPASEEVPVVIERDRDRLMSESIPYHERINASLDEQGDMGMPEIVDSAWCPN
jgi:hypothetical protein